MIFIDTGAWVALADAADKYHAQALAIRQRLLDETIGWLTTNFVVAESFTLLPRKLGHTSAHEFLKTIREWERLTCFSASRDLELQAEELLRHYADQDFSYVDAISFATMKQFDVAEAFAFDHHFLVAGFTLISS